VSTVYDVYPVCTLSFHLIKLLSDLAFCKTFVSGRGQSHIA